MNIQINEQLGQEQSSYVAPYYTLDCALGINSLGAPKLSPELGAELLKEVDLYYCHSHLAELATNTACYVGTKPEQLTFTNGSLGALELIFNKLLPKEKSMLGVGPQFVEAVSEFQIAGGTYRSLNMFDYWNEDELLHALKAELKSNPPTIVYIDNPNNPTGLIYTRTTLMELCRACNEVGSILLIDEAYGEFLAVEESMIGATAEFDNLIVLRTFSKGLGLAGIRLGYAVSSKKLAHYLNQSVLPFAPSLPAIKVANHVLCNMGTYLRDTQEQTQTYKVELMELLSEHGIEVMPTSIKTPILLAYMKGVDLAGWLKKAEILTCSGSHFHVTCQEVDEQYTRMRVVGNRRDLVQLDQRIGHLTSQINA